MSMFNGKFKPELQAQISTTSTPVSSVIAAGTIIKGDITSNADIRIEGTLTGNVTCNSKIIIGPGGLVEGDISGQQADIIGKINGTIKIKDLLQLKGESVIQGNIYAGRLQIEPSATFNGECHMVSAGSTEVSTIQYDQFVEE